MFYFVLLRIISNQGAFRQKAKIRGIQAAAAIGKINHDVISTCVLVFSVAEGVASANGIFTICWGHSFGHGFYSNLEVMIHSSTLSMIFIWYIIIMYFIMCHVEWDWCCRDCWFVACSDMFSDGATKATGHLPVVLVAQSLIRQQKDSAGQ